MPEVTSLLRHADVDQRAVVGLVIKDHIRLQRPQSAQVKRLAEVLGHELGEFFRLQEGDILGLDSGDASNTLLAHFLAAGDKNEPL